MKDLVCNAFQGVSMRDYYQQVGDNLHMKHEGLMLGGASSYGTLPAGFLYSGCPADQDSPKPGSFGMLLAGQFFGEFAATAAQTKLSEFLSKQVTPAVDAMLRRFKHVGKIQYARRSTQKSQLSAYERKTNEAFLQLNFYEDIGGGEVLECHSVFPLCFGKWLTARQAQFSAYTLKMLKDQGFEHATSGQH